MGVGLLALLYLNENWQGRRAWKAYVAEAEAAGERLQPEAVIPPHVSDVENFATVPLFRRLFEYETTKNAEGKRETVWKDLEHDEFINSLKLPFKPSGRSWRDGVTTDFRNLQEQGSATADASGVEIDDPVSSALAILRRFDPVLEQVEEAASRPKSRFPLHYEDGISMLHPHTSPIRDIGQILRFRASARLASGDVEGALDDVRLLFRLGDAVGASASVISYLAEIALEEMTMQPLWEGLVEHKWSDQQLAGFQARFVGLNHASKYQRAIRAERNLCGLPLFDGLRKKRGQLGSTILGMNSDYRPSPLGLENALFSLTPEGWFDLNKAYIGGLYQRIIGFAEAAPPRFHPDRMRAFQDEMDQDYFFAKDLRTFLARFYVIVIPGVVERSARAQGMVDLTLIALILERHHLRHGNYPIDLANLDPGLAWGGDGIPPDQITGRPPRYRVTEDGRFLLYYDGWNEQDDGGKVVYRKGPNPKIDFKQGDWVWPQPVQP